MFEVAVADDPDVLAACCALYRRVFVVDGSDDGLNPRLLAGIVHNGGVLVAACAGSEVIGFVFGFLARERHDGSLYHYSQAAAVAEQWRGQGVGRALKLEQRAAVLALGLPTMRWIFDPFSIRNAHFNLNVLGARAVALRRAAYGAHGTTGDLTGSSDRLLADWDLQAGPPASERQSPAPVSDRTPEVGEVVRDGVGALLGIPAAGDPKLTGRARARTLERLEALFADGLEACACRRVDEGRAVYRFERRARAAQGGGGACA